MEEYAVFYPPNGKNYTIVSSSGRLGRYRVFLSSTRYLLFLLQIMFHCYSVKFIRLKE